MTPSAMGGAGVSLPATPSAGPFAKRASVFTGQAVVPSTIQLLQKTLFSKLHEEVLALLQVIPRKNDQSNSAADEQAYFLVLTLNSQIKKSVDGFGAPKLHWVKIKVPEAGSGMPGGGEVSYTHKKFKLLKLLKRIDIPPSGGGAATGTASGSLRKREEFTLVFTSGNTDKLYTFGMKAGAGAAGSQASTPAGAGAGVGVTSNPDRAVFIWYCLEMCRIYCGFVPTSNIDTVLYQQLTNEITAYYLQPGGVGVGGAAPGAGLSAQHKELMVAVSKNRHNALENDTRSLDRINIEEKVIVPSMTAEETKLVQLFLKQIDHSAGAAAVAVKPGGSPTSGASTSLSLGGAPSHSNINELESYLLHKLSQIEAANIESLFDPSLEAANARILRDDIQSNLLDNKLEEMSLWINHHNAELTKMKKGIEQIEKRNLSLDIQEKNQTALHQTLHLVLDSLKLDDDETDGGVERLLEHPDFSTGRLERTLAAAQRLDHILHLEIEEGKLEELRAVKEQRLKYEGVRKKFTKQAAAAIEGVFQETAKKAVHGTNRTAWAGRGGRRTSRGGRPEQDA